MPPLGTSYHDNARFEMAELYINHFKFNPKRNNWWGEGCETLA